MYPTRAIPFGHHSNLGQPTQRGVHLEESTAAIKAGLQLICYMSSFNFSIASPSEMRAGKHDLKSWREGKEIKVVHLGGKGIIQTEYKI